MRGSTWVASCLCWIWIAASAEAAPPPAPDARIARALDKPAFTASPAELLAIAHAAPADDEHSPMLREYHDVSYDDRGRATARRRWIYVVRDPDRRDDDDEGDSRTIYAPWHPSYQDAPAIRARVIQTDGTVVQLDPAQITEAKTPAQRSGAVEERDLEAHLPPLSRGAVVEAEIATTDREAPLGGSVHILRITDPMPSSGRVLSLSAPAAAKLHEVARGLPSRARVEHRVVAGREIWTYDLVPQKLEADPELDAPDDVVTGSYVGIAAAASWEAVARAWRAEIERRITERPFALPTELRRGSPQETAEAITAWVHAHVRRAGGEFLEPVRPPRSPAETVQQGSGDRNDLAALIVALLRQAQIGADVALLAPQWAGRFDADLPGATSLGRALVRARIGDRDVWIDPVEELARVGQLPASEQGRRVLVLAPGSRALAATPASTAADNQIHEIRTFAVPEREWPDVTWVMRYSGAFEAAERAEFRSSVPDVARRAYERQAKDMLGGTLERVASTPVDDLAQPFEVTATVRGVHRLYSDIEKIGAYVSAHDAMTDLPWELTRPNPAPRRHDFVWPEPHVHEIENRIVLPPGFTPPAAGPERVRQLGTATLTERRRVDGNTLVVTFRFDTGKRRVTAAEFNALRTALEPLTHENEHITIDHTAFALRDAGKLREAIAECERMIALHPAEALHHSDLALVLIDAGAGGAARREARKAVALEPANAGAHVALGLVLSHDTLGREYSYDWDRAGAIAEFRKAIALDPTHAGAATSLAQTLLRGPSGRPYEGGDLAAGVDAWRAAFAIKRSDEAAVLYAESLLWSGEFAEAEKIARGADSHAERRDMILIAAIAAGRGAEAGVQEIAQLRTGTARQDLRKSAAWFLIVAQRYAAARDLLTAGGASQLSPNEASIVRLLPDWHRASPRPGDPRSAVSEVIAAMLDPRHKTHAFWDAQLERALGEGIQNDARMQGAMAMAWLIDLTEAKLDYQLTAQAGAWHATSAAQVGPLYLVLDRGAVKLVGTSDDLSGVGRYILHTGKDARADVRARVLLDWIRADLDGAKLTGHEQFKRVWGPGITPSHDAILLAAAVLAGASDPDRVIEVATRCASTLPDAEQGCGELLFWSHVARKRWIEAVADDEAIFAARPGARNERVRQHAWVLAQAGRIDEAQQMVAQVLASDPDHHDALVARFLVAMVRRAGTEVLQAGDALINSRTATSSDCNEVAWTRLVLGVDPPGALEIARKGVPSAKKPAAILNTVAALEAELGDLGRAVADERKSLQARNAIEPGPGDWYVVGRIDEQLGLTSDAIAAYRRVTGPDHDAGISAYDLAQRRLTALAASP